jgi:hypothetical protein
MSRHAEPDFVTDYKRWLAAGPPHCCHTCEHYGVDGLCVEFFMQPPPEFAEAVGECPKWEEEVQF